MPTTVTKVVDPDQGTGWDYSSLSNWEAGEQGDLTGARDEIAVAKCRCTGGTADTTPVVVNGWTTDSTRYIKIWTDPAESYRHNGTYQTGNKYRIEVEGTQIAIQALPPYIRIDGIAIKGTSSNYEVTGLYLQDISYVSNCIAKFVYGQVSADCFAFRVDAVSKTHYFWNCIAYGGWALGFQNNYSTAYAYNCTSFGCSDRGFNGITTLKNCISANNVDDFASCTTIDHCASDDGDGTNAVDWANESTDWANVFVDYANGDFHLKNYTGTGKVVDMGVSDPGSGLFSNDIDGQTRSGSWDIGADEYVAAVSFNPYWANNANQYLGHGA